MVTTLDKIFETENPQELDTKLETFLEPLKTEQLSNGLTYYDLAVISAYLSNNEKISVANMVQGLCLSADEAQHVFDRLVEIDLIVKFGDGHMIDRVTTGYLMKRTRKVLFSGNNKDYLVDKNTELFTKMAEYVLAHPHNTSQKSTKAEPAEYSPFIRRQMR